MKYFEKTALDIATTKAILRSIKNNPNIYSKVIRSVKPGSNLPPALYRTKLPKIEIVKGDPLPSNKDVIYIERGFTNPTDALGHEYGHFLDRKKLLRSDTVDTTEMLARERTANRNAVKTIARHSTDPKNTIATFKLDAAPAYKTYLASPNLTVTKDGYHQIIDQQKEIYERVSPSFKKPENAQEVIQIYRTLRSIFKKEIKGYKEAKRFDNAYTVKNRKKGYIEK